MCDTHRVRHLLTSWFVAVAILLGGVGLSVQTVAASTGFVQPEAATSTPSPWSSGTLAETPQGNLSSISCPVSSFCMAIHVREMSSPTTESWSEPSIVDPGPESTVTPTISCASSSFCVVVDGEGSPHLYGTSWSTPDFIDSSGGLDSVSRSSVKFCVAVNDVRSLPDDGTKRTGSSSPSARSWVSAQSHASLHNFRVCSSSNGAFIYSGTSWSASRRIYTVVSLQDRATHRAFVLP